MLKINPSLDRLSNSNTAVSEVLRTIVFPIDKYQFALPVKTVLKIIPCPPIEHPIEDCIGLVEWERQTITVVDLQQKLVTNRPQSTQTTDFSDQFLILIKIQDGELCGFLTRQSPSLIDIPLTAIHPVPFSFRQVAKLGFVKNMAILTDIEAEAANIFLLGVN